MTVLSVHSTQLNSLFLAIYFRGIKKDTAPFIRCLMVTSTGVKPVAFSFEAKGAFVTLTGRGDPKRSRTSSHGFAGQCSYPLSYRVLEPKWGIEPQPKVYKTLAIPLCYSGIFIIEYTLIKLNLNPLIISCLFFN